MAKGRLWLAAAIAAPLMAGPAAAEGVKAMFEKYNLIGTFAFDCTKPATVNNLYYTDRVIDDNTIQRDRMSGVDRRDSVFFIDKVQELGPHEIKVSGTQSNDPMEQVWRVAPQGMTVWLSSINGKLLIQDGKVVGTTIIFPAIHRCK